MTTELPTEAPTAPETAAPQRPKTSWVQKVPAQTFKWIGYGRVSDPKQEYDSPDAQKSRIEAYVALQRTVNPDVWNAVSEGQVYLEPYAQSAYKRPFDMRPAGRRIMSLLKPGDQLVIDRVDRMWRNRLDFEMCLKQLREKHVAVHFVNWGGASVDMTQPSGEFFLVMTVAQAQWESSMNADRQHKARKRRREQTRYAGGPVYWACDLTGKLDKETGVDTRKYKWNKLRRAQMAYIVRLRDWINPQTGEPDGMCFTAIARMLEKGQFLRGGEARQRPYWSRHRVEEGYWLHKALAEIGNPEPAQIESLPRLWKRFRAHYYETHGDLPPGGTNRPYGSPDPISEAGWQDPDEFGMPGVKAG